MAKAPNTPSTPTGSSDDPSWMRDQQNPTTPDNDSADQSSRDAEAARQAAAERTGTAQTGNTQQ